jgi:hypothetical protein
MSGAKNMYDEIDDFFGAPGTTVGGKDDKRGRLFTSLNYKGNNFSESLNTKENPETIKNEPIFQLMLAKNYTGKETLGDNVISDQFIDFVRSVGTRHASIDGKLQAPTTAGMTADKLAHIYANWPNMSHDGRDFYSQLINLVNITESRSVAPAPFVGMNVREFRLNLKKVDASQPASETIFGKTLPYLPSGCVAEGSTATLAVDHLHKVYDNAVRGTRSAFVGGAASELSSWEAVGLNVSVFLRNIAYIQKKALSSPSGVKGELGDIYDLTTDKIYSMKDGKLVDASENVMDEARYQKDVADNCEGTYLPSCELVFECLLSGDPKGLSRCLGKLSIESMYVVAKSECAKMNPKVMKKVLSTFDIRTNKHGKVEEYIEWRGSLESRLTQKLGGERGAKTAGAILANKKLLEYLRNLMEVIRSNPVLTNDKGVTLSDLPDKTGDKIKYFIKPTNINRAAALSTQLGTLVNQLNVLPQNFVSQFNGPLNWANVNFGSPMMLPPFSGMRGGGCVEDSVATMEAIYNQILEEMKRNGKDLVDDDKKRIENAIDQIKKNNSQLVSALNDLKGFMRLNSAITNGLTNVSLNDIKGSSNVDLSNQIRSFESSINNTANSQVSLMTALIDQVFRPMALIASGSSTSLLRPI